MNNETEKDLSANENSEFGNVLKFEKNADRLSALAEEKFKEGDDENALTFAYACEAEGNLTPALCAAVAEVLFKHTLHDRAAYYWFKYLNMVTERHFARAYNGLGACYLHMGNDLMAGYYFNLQLKDPYNKPQIYDDYMYSFFSSNPMFDEDDEPDEEDDEFWFRYGENEFDLDYGEPSKKQKKSAFKPRLVSKDGEPQDDWSVVFEKGVKKIKQSPVSAENFLSFIPPESPYYEKACFYRAIAAWRIKEIDLALELFKSVDKNSPHRQSAVRYIYAICFVKGDKAGENKAAAEILSDQGCCGDLDFIADDISRLYDKTKGYEFAVKLKGLFPLNEGFNCFLAAYAYNAGKFEESAELFSEYCRLTRSLSASYYFSAALSAKNGKKILDEIVDPFYLPAESAAEITIALFKYTALAPSTLRRKANEVFGYVEQAFFVPSSEIQNIASAVVGVIGGDRAKNFLKQKLLDPEVHDDVKSAILSVLVQMGHDRLTGAVFAGLYMRLQFERVEFVGEKNSIFTDAYALAFGTIAPYPEAKLYKLKIAAYEIFNKLCRNGCVKKVTDVSALAAVIEIQAKASGLTKKEVIENLYAEKKTVKQIEDLLKKE